MRILLVEDEHLVAEYLKRSLVKAGHDVDYAADGQVAYSKAHKKTYDVIILDIILPKLTGIEVCRRIRSEGVRTPVIMLTSMDAEKSRVDGLDSGADDYMVKPFSFLELEARLRALIRRPDIIIDDEISFNTIRMSQKKHLVWLDDIEVELRSKEFAVLQYLIINQQRVVSRDELLARVWGINPENASNRADACIKELRNKLGKDVIETVHTVGYRLAS
jgi:DNA-binding response OmpR family regulator